MTLILSRMALFLGNIRHCPCRSPFRLLKPMNFLLDNPGDVLIYDSEEEGVYYSPTTPDQTKHAILLNHGLFDGSIDQFLREHGDGKVVDFRGTIRIQDNCPRTDGIEYGSFKGTAKIAIWDYPPYQDDDRYVTEGDCPWIEFHPIQRTGTL